MPLTVLGFLFLYFGGIFWAFTRSPVWGLMPYALALYLSPAHNWFGVYLPNLRWSLLASVCALIAIILNGNKLVAKTRWYNTFPVKILILYTCWMWLQYPMALHSAMHLEGSILFSKYIILYYMVYRLLNTDEDFFKFFLFNIIGAFYISRQVLNYSVGGRVEGIGGPGINDANSLGMHLSVVLIFTAMILLKKNPMFRNQLYWRGLQFLSLISGAYIAHSVVQTISRSAVLGIVAAGMFLFIIKHRIFKKKFYIYLVLALIGLVYLAPPTFWNRMDSITEAFQGEEEVESSAYSRLVIGKAMIEMFKANIWGVGHRGTIVLSPFYMPPEYLTSVGGQAGRSSHCTFLTTLTEQGVPGALLYLLMVGWCIQTIFSFRKDDPAMYLYFMGVSASLVCIFVAGIFVDYLKAEIQIYCFAMLASLKDHQLRARYNHYLSQKTVTTPGK